MSSVHFPYVHIPSGFSMRAGFGAGARGWNCFLRFLGSSLPRGRASEAM
jgi:hypothetical protein